MILLAAIAIFTVIGAATANVFQVEVPSTMESRIATWFLLGIGVNGTLLFLLGRASIAVFVAAMVVLFIRRRGRQRPAERRVVCELLAVTPLLVVLVVSMIVPLADFDGRTTWLPKAVAIAHENSIRGPFFQGEAGLNLHNHYPLLLPLDVATLMKATNTLDVDQVRPFYVLIPIAMVLALADTLGWLAAVIAWLPPLLVFHEGGALSAYSDIAVVAFVGLALADRRSAPLWLTFLVLTKSEGILLAAAIVIAFRSWKIAIAPALAALLLAVWRVGIPDAYDERYGVLLRGLPHELDRIPAAAGAFASHAFDVRVWGVFWVAFVVAAVVRWRSPFAIAVVLAIAGYIVAFAVTSWSIADLANVAANRLLLHLAVPAAFLMKDAFLER